METMYVGFVFYFYVEIEANQKDTISYQQTKPRPVLNLDNK